MGKQVVFRGTAANDGTGDNLRLGAQKINENFTELYTALGDGSSLASGNYVTTSANQVLANKTISGATNTINHIQSRALSTLTNYNTSTLQKFDGIFRYSKLTGLIYYPV